MSDNRLTWKEFADAWKQVPSHLYNTALTIWATPLWWKIAQTIFLVTLFGGMWFSIDSMIAYMDGLSAGDAYEYKPVHELIFWGWLFGTIAGMFIYRTIYEFITIKILLFLNCIDEDEII
jgi:hypothetical protein